MRVCVFTKQELNIKPNAFVTYLQEFVDRWTPSGDDVSLRIELSQHNSIYRPT